MLYREWTLKPTQRRGVMLPLHRFDSILRSKDPGYASMYAFSETDAQEIITSQSSAGMGRYSVYADTLTIDLDNGDEQLQLLEPILEKQGLAYVLWASGGKGYHVVLPHGQMHCSPFLPHSQRVWVEGLGVGADLSLYQHGRILSLPGRIHPKTGKPKALVKYVTGQDLKLKIVEPEIRFDFQSNGGLDDLEAGLMKCLQSLADEPSPGNRHTRLWSTAKHFADFGMSYEFTHELMQKVNEQWHAPKATEEVTTAVNQAFKRKSGQA